MSAKRALSSAGAASRALPVARAPSPHPPSPWAARRRCSFGTSRTRAATRASRRPSPRSVR
eukprot:29570-Pelagococcus_subviridis.AAC.16